VDATKGSGSHRDFQVPAILLRWRPSPVRVWPGADGGAKTFKWANSGDVSSMDPMPVRETFSSPPSYSKIYDPLISRDKDMKLEPAARTKWGQTDPTTGVLRHSRYRSRLQGTDLHERTRGRPQTTHCVLA